MRYKKHTIKLFKTICISLCVSLYTCSQAYNTQTNNLELDDFVLVESNENKNLRSIQNRETVESIAPNAIDQDESDLIEIYNADLNDIVFEEINYDLDPTPVKQVKTKKLLLINDYIDINNIENKIDINYAIGSLRSLKNIRIQETINSVSNDSKLNSLGLDQINPLIQTTSFKDKSLKPIKKLLIDVLNEFNGDGNEIIFDEFSLKQAAVNKPVECKKLDRIYHSGCISNFNLNGVNNKTHKLFHNTIFNKLDYYINNNGWRGFVNYLTSSSYDLKATCFISKNVRSSGNKGVTNLEFTICIKPEYKIYAVNKLPITLNITFSKTYCTFENDKSKLSYDHFKLSDLQVKVPSLLKETPLHKQIKNNYPGLYESRNFLITTQNFFF